MMRVTINGRCICKAKDSAIPPQTPRHSTILMWPSSTQSLSLEQSGQPPGSPRMSWRRALKGG
jgi:hypothetical protein